MKASHGRQQNGGRRPADGGDTADGRPLAAHGQEQQQWNGFYFLQFINATSPDISQLRPAGSQEDPRC